jgi:exopolysaccharide biosynthesis polyprenyl glycosylphosphotransferase
VVAATPRPRRAGTIIARAIVTGADVAVIAACVALLHPSVAGWLFGGACFLVLAGSGTHQARLSLSALDDAPRLSMAGAIAGALTVPFADAGTDLARAVLVAVAGVVFGRAIAYAVVRRRRRHGRREPTIIAGSGHVAIELAHLITLHPEYGLDVVGFVGASFPDLPGPLLGDVAHLDELVTELDVRRVIVAFGPTREVDLVGVLRTAVLRSVQVYVVPRFFEIGVAPRSIDTDDVWGIPLLRVRQAAFTASSWKIKRGIDIGAAAGLLVLTAPVWALAALAVRVSSPGPILFRQRRIGQSGREFEVLKFRTLPVDHVDDCWNAEDLQYDNTVGRWLRRLSVDELPQLWNVLRGDMSLVGPRPERGYLVEEFNTTVHGYRDRHRLPMGLTGWAQVHGLRGETSLRERVRFDNQYIEHWSLWRDCTIMIRTIGAVFRRPHRASPSDGVTGTRFGIAATSADTLDPPIDTDSAEETPA